MTKKGFRWCGILKRSGEPWSLYSRLFQVSPKPNQNYAILPVTTSRIRPLFRRQANADAPAFSTESAEVFGALLLLPLRCGDRRSGQPKRTHSRTQRTPGENIQRNQATDRVRVFLQPAVPPRSPQCHRAAERCSADRCPGSVSERTTTELRNREQIDHHH